MPNMSSSEHSQSTPTPTPTPTTRTFTISYFTAKVACLELKRPIWAWNNIFTIWTTSLQVKFWNRDLVLMCFQVKYLTHGSITFTKFFSIEVQISHFLTNFNLSTSCLLNHNEQWQLGWLRTQLTNLTKTKARTQQSK